MTRFPVSRKEKNLVAFSTAPLRKFVGSEFVDFTGKFINKKRKDVQSQKFQRNRIKLLQMAGK